ncbi:hypothetical protein EVAR_37509_1 [Eumeta japonica]|uniref:RNase H type-1 domain-containing protein n=1 Tax=Eumeta variegata TaxID=151549 RepID=A0A4C1XB93_EUMVA|nr:hypothetical protein EVAR_37509_1 [Eumeta japonica]
MKRGKDMTDTFVDTQFKKPICYGKMPHPEHVPDIGYESVEGLDSQTSDRLAIVGTHINNDGSRIEAKVEILTGPKAYQTLAYEARPDLSEIVSESRAVRLFWVRAHARIAGHERADKLSRRAALARKTAADYNRFPLSYAKRVIRAASLKKWKERYTEASMGEITDCFFPRVEQEYWVL